RSSAASETNLQGTTTSVLSGRRNTNPWTVRQRRMHTTRPLPSFISTPSRSSRNRSEAMSTRCPSEVLLGATPGVLRPRGTSGVQVHAGLLYLPLSGGIRFGPLRILLFQLGDQGAGSLFGVHLSLQRLDPSVVGFEQRGAGLLHRTHQRVVFFGLVLRHQLVVGIRRPAPVADGDRRFGGALSPQRL